LKTTVEINAHLMPDRCSWVRTLC